MEHLPIFLDLKGRRALVVGGGEPAAAKVRLLRRARAAITVIADAPVAEITALGDRGALILERRAFDETDLVEAAVVIVTTGDAEKDAAVAAVAKAEGVPVNVVDRAGLSTFLMPAIIDREPITVAVSSAGTAPVLARRVRERIEAMLPANLGALARFAERFRGAVQTQVTEPPLRRRFWESVFSGPVAEDVLAGHEARASERMLAAINRRQPDEARRGVVHIVGAGPGDPDLLTLRAVRLMQEADVIVHDRLVAPEVLDLARRDAERIDVGKSKGDHSHTQDQINDLLVRHALDGRRVVRLKGGDPFVFGRGGEEREALARHGVHAEVVPGITAATGCAAAAGISLTHRDFAHALTLVTGHGRDGEPAVDWAAAARGGQTLAVYMGGSAATTIAERLMAEGMAATTPVAVIVNGTRRNQRVVTGSLADLGALAASVAGQGPSLLIIGEAARTADAWQDPASAERRAPLAAVL